jgi:hypothetical protein
VIDQNLSFGSGGVLHGELCSALYGMPDMPILLSFIGGLGGRDIAHAELIEMARLAAEAADRGEVPAAASALHARRVARGAQAPNPCACRARNRPGESR